MGINLTNFLSSQSKNTKMIDFQDLDHLDGLSISVVSANLYKDIRDDLTMFYFREGANYASVYTQSKIVSENIKWNLNQRPKKIYSLIVNTRNANAFTGKQGYEIGELKFDFLLRQYSIKSKNIISDRGIKIEQIEGPFETFEGQWSVYTKGDQLCEVVFRTKFIRICKIFFEISIKH